MSSNGVDTTVEPLLNKVNSADSGNQQMRVLCPRNKYGGTERDLGTCISENESESFYASICSDLISRGVASFEVHWHLMNSTDSGITIIGVCVFGCTLGELG